MKTVKYIINNIYKMAEKDSFENGCDFTSSQTSLIDLKIWERKGNIMLTDKELMTLHDRLADILCYVTGFHNGIVSNPNGNQKQRQTMIELCIFVMKRAQEQKDVVSKSLK